MLTRAMALRGALLVCLGGALWALLSSGKCGSCDRAADLVSGINLGLLGVVFYGALFALALFAVKRVPSSEHAATARERLFPVVAAAMLVAAGAHAALVLFLFRNKTFCAPCLLTACAAFVAAATILSYRGVYLRNGVVGLLVAAAVSYGAVRALKPSDSFWKHRVAIRAGERLRREAKPIPTGQARVIAFMRPGCHRCEAFEKYVIPALGRDYPKTVQLELRQAASDMNTPTVVVLGARDTVFDGVLTWDDMQGALRAAMGTADLTPAKMQSGILLTEARR